LAVVGEAQNDRVSSDHSQSETAVAPFLSSVDGRSFWAQTCGVGLVLLVAWALAGRGRAGFTIADDQAAAEGTASYM
jgi:hypothetical protein